MAEQPAADVGRLLLLSYDGPAGSSSAPLGAKSGQDSNSRFYVIMF